MEQRVSEAALGVDPEYQWRRNQHEVIIFNLIVQLWGNLKYVYFVEIEKGSIVWKLKIWKLALSYLHGYENWERRGMWDSLIFKLLLTDCLLHDRPIKISITSFDFLKGCKTLKKDMISNLLTFCQRLWLYVALIVRKAIVSSEEKKMMRAREVKRERVVNLIWQAVSLNN